MFWKKHTESTLRIIPELCAGCGKCVSRCRRDALRLHYRDDIATVWLAYPERCTGCGACVKKCHMQALYTEEKQGRICGAFE